MASYPTVKTGTAGWSYPDWVGPVYPGKKPDLSFLSQFIDCVEVNATFYRLFSPSQANRWMQSIQKFDFKFHIKLWQGFTHENKPVRSEEMQAFRELVDRLLAKNRLGVVLIQFPWRFKYAADTLNRLTTVLDALQPFPCAVEFRHISWNRTDIVGRLGEYQAVFVNIDQPVIGNSLPLTSHASDKRSYFRLHGRNYNNWFNDNAGRDDRYDYLYSLKEINQFKQTIHAMPDFVDTVYTIFNNHFKGQALVNSIQFKAMVEGGKGLAPASLLKAYPALSEWAQPDTPQQSALDL